MRIHHGLDSWSFPAGTRTAATLGNFDGVHLGHQLILRRVREAAAAAGLESVILTFDPVPKKILTPETAPPLIQTLEQRMQRLESLGMDHVIVIPFTREFAAVEAADFVRDFLAGRLRIRFIAVGDNFTFGRHRHGNIQLLRELGTQLGFDVDNVPQVQLDGHRISSTLIRDRVRSGLVEKAMQYLGAPFSLTGMVARGERVGVTIGVPTANLQPENELIPANGVYVCRALTGGMPHKAVVNVGFRPTVGGKQRTIEAHLLDYDGDLYGKRLELQFLHRLRQEVRFSGLDALKAQIRKDIDAARQYFDSQESQ